MKTNTPLYLYCLLVAFASAVLTPVALASPAEEIRAIRGAAVAFLDSLSEDQRATCNLDFEHADRVDWKYVPADRLGIAMRDLNAGQREKLDTLLAAIVSAEGLEKAKGVILCETALFENSGGSEFRHPGKYHLTVYGTPQAKDPWGLRFEGHHISLNYTFAGDKAIAAAPAFFGANPATILEGPNKGLRILKDEEDMGRALVLSLSDAQKAVAIFRETALKEIVTRAESEVSPLEPIGIAYGKLNADQQKQLMAIVGEYISWMPDDVGAERLRRIVESGLEDIRFGWAGGTDKGLQHYYRVQGPSFLIEYDNFQGGGTHIHAVWRDFNGDFGRDLLKEHYEHGHAH